MTGLICVIALALVACAGQPVDPGADGGGDALVYELEAPEVVRAGGPVPLRFTLRNEGDHPLWVLAWYTPLEGLFGDILHVTRDGVVLEYQGPMVKRAAPTAEDYVRLDAGEEVRNEVDLALAYDLAREGRYEVDFQGRLHDVARDGEGLDRRVDRSEPRQISGHGARFRVVR